MEKFILVPIRLILCFNQLADCIFIKNPSQKDLILFLFQFNLFFIFNDLILFNLFLLFFPFP